MDDFNKPKIVYGQFQDSAEYSFAEKRIYLSSNEYMITTHNYSAKCLLAFLNSKVIEWLLGKITGNLGGNAKIGQKSNFLKLSIAFLPNREQLIFDKLVESILDKKSTPQYIISTEFEIDRLIYNIYKLTKEEIEVIEKS